MKQRCWLPPVELSRRENSMPSAPLRFWDRDGPPFDDRNGLDSTLVTHSSSTTKGLLWADVAARVRKLLVRHRAAQTVPRGRGSAFSLRKEACQAIGQALATSRHGTVRLQHPDEV